MPRLRLNEKTIRTRKYPVGKQVIIWDETLPAFGAVTSTQTGKFATYVVQSRINGKSARRKIGRVDAMDYADAKAKAKKLLVGFNDGVDPKVKKAAGATLDQTLAGYIEANAKLKPRSVEFYRATVTRHLGDWLDAPAASITRDMVEKRHRQIAEDVEARDRAENAKRAKEHLVRAERAEKHWPEAAERYRMKHQAAKERKARSGGGVADGTMRCLRALMNFAIDKDSTIGANPVRLKKQWFEASPRDRLVRADDMKKFYGAVVTLENPVHRDYLILLLFTGLRRREAASLRWADVDLRARVIRVPAANTKSGKKLDLPMSDVVYDTLAARRTIGNTTFVFPADSGSGHIEEPKFPLSKIAASCNVQVSAHDLRRSYITAAESADISVMALKALVNHSLGKGTTEGYIKMTTERLREPAQRVADKLKDLCGIRKGRRYNSKV